MPTRTEAIKSFLTAYAQPDLANLYNDNMECQVTVAKDNGERVVGEYKGRQWHAYTDGIQNWYPIRIPYKGNSEPTFADSEMKYDLKAHAEGIGMTGWDWKNQKSLWVAFDFDAIIGHSDRHNKKLTDDQLNDIKSRVMDIPWLTIRKSTGGKGLHLYAFLEPETTTIRNEHSAKARAILSYLSALVSFDFSKKVDVIGSNMWCWHRKLASTNGEGLKFLKQHTSLVKVPPNWRDYLNVVSGQRIKNRPQYIDRQLLEFEQLTGQRLHVPLDDDHKRIFAWLTERYQNCTWWDSDHHMMITHTILLKECHEELKLKGIFNTIATGENKGNDINSFCYPLPKGAFAVYRYTPGVQEHESWIQDGQTWTKCNFNKYQDLSTACKINEGIENTKNGYCFPSSEKAQKAADLLGISFDLPPWILMRECKFTPHKISGKIIVEISKVKEDPPLPGWISEKKAFTKIYDIDTPNELDVTNLDPQIRHLISENRDDAGWVIKSDNHWHSETFYHVREFIKSLGYNAKDVSTILGTSIANCWMLVNMPFQDEYPSERKWNRNAVQLLYKPKILKAQCPTWDLILTHIGKSLNETITNHEWCKENDIICGADYLKCWIASLFQCPTEPLPYLFLYGNEDCGKSILHESLSLLISHNGTCRADAALINSSAFNGELEHSILAVIEETELKRNTPALNRLKDWVTAQYISIHKKGQTPYLTRNTNHFIQTSNSHNACPILPGDSRIVMIYVSDIDPKDLIPKKQLMIQLKAEAEDFITEIMEIELPISDSRLNIPIINTHDKIMTGISNQTVLEMYLDEHTFVAPGYAILFSELYAKFQEYLDPSEISFWNKAKFGREMPPIFPKGRLGIQSQFHFGNISLMKIEEKDFKNEYIYRNGWLVPKT